jgi:SnoaL-like domain
MAGRQSGCDTQPLCDTMNPLQSLAARAAVLEVVHRYFRCLDTHDADGLRACVSPDLRARHTLTGEIAGREAFLAVAIAAYPGLDCTQHYCCNEEIEVDGDRALCRAYLYAQHAVTTGGSAMLMPGGGRYTFELTRSGEDWIIARLANDVTWMHPGLDRVFRPD